MENCDHLRLGASTQEMVHFELFSGDPQVPAGAEKIEAEVDVAAHGIESAVGIEIPNGIKIAVCWAMIFSMLGGSSLKASQIFLDGSKEMRASGKPIVEVNLERVLGGIG